MKVHVQAEGRNIQISLPTGLIFSRFVLRTAARSIRINGRHVPGLTVEGADALSREVKALKRRHGSWTLVEVRGADGSRVTITL